MKKKKIFKNHNNILLYIQIVNQMNKLDNLTIKRIKKYTNELHFYDSILNESIDLLYYIIKK
jgi:lipopolysaccharide export LptBFGC system permease protein LptF